MLEAEGNSLAELQKAIRTFQGRQGRRVDPKGGLRQAIDALKAELTEVEAIQGGSPDRPATKPMDPG